MERANSYDKSPNTCVCICAIGSVSLENANTQRLSPTTTLTLLSYVYIYAHVYLFISISLYLYQYISITINSCVYTCGSQLGTICPPGDISNIWRHFSLSQLRGEGCHWHLVRRGQGCYSIFYKAQDSPSQVSPAKNVTSAKVEKSLSIPIRSA